LKLERDGRVHTGKEKENSADIVELLIFWSSLSCILVRLQVLYRGKEKETRYVERNAK